MNVDAGDIFVVDPYPFIRELVELPPDDPEATDFRKVMSWRPGIGYEIVGPEGEADPVCDGFGSQILTVVSVHKPGRYPTRVFYTRQWVSPDGKAFGRQGLRIATLEKFRRLASGFGVSANIPAPRLRNVEPRR